MSKTLVIILGDTRATELTYNNFKTNLLDVLNADLCLCLAVKADYNYLNPYYKQSKYNFLYYEPEDFATAFEQAYKTIIDKDRRSKNYVHWHHFVELTEILFGGVKHNNNIIPGGGGIVLFLRWFLLKNIKENNLIKKYDRFIITRSDFIYELPHPTLDLLDPNYIWFPDGEYSSGFTDRHVVLSTKNLESYLNILDHLVINSRSYYNKLKTLFLKKSHKRVYNIESFIKFHLYENGLINKIRTIPYIMYLVRLLGGHTRYTIGTYNEKLGYYIKNQMEFTRATYFKNLFIKQKNPINHFYKTAINLRKKCIVITTINKPSIQILHYTNQPGWDLIIVGDSKTDNAAYKEINCIYLGLNEQEQLFPTLFEKIPLQSYTRKMFGYLYAIKEKYDIIYDTDDDNKYIYNLDHFETNITENIGKDMTGNDIFCESSSIYNIDNIKTLISIKNGNAYNFNKETNTIWIKNKTTEYTDNPDCICGQIRTEKVCLEKGFVNIYKIYTDAHIWPRGIPPTHTSIITNPQITDTHPTNLNVAIIQGLVNNDPDVDAYYRINVNDKPFVFEKDPQYDIVMGKYSVCPFNTQNTFWNDRTMFYAMYLPITVTFRYTDILRGFIALYQLWLNDKTIKFTFPTAYQERNPHDLNKDYESEIPMYETAEKVIELLNNNKEATMKDIYQILYEEQIVKMNEIEALDIWTNLVNKFI